MRPLTLALLILLPSPALADDCADRLRAALATDLAAEGPYVAMNTNVMAGQEQVYRQSFVSDRHFLVEVLKPEGLPDTLHYEGGAWNGDGAGGWSLAWQMDADEAAAGIEAQRQAAAAAVRSAACRSEGGTLHIDGTLGPTPHLGDAAAVVFVIDEASDAVSAFSYAYTLNGMDVTARYQITREPDLTLPVPAAR